MLSCCLTPMFPLLTLAQGLLVAPDRAWVTPCSRTPAPAPSHSARPSGDAGPCAADGRDNSPDTRPAADRAAHVPFATDRHRTRLAAAPSPQRADQAGAGRAAAGAGVGGGPAPPPPPRPPPPPPGTRRWMVHRPQRA